MDYRRLLEQGYATIARTNPCSRLEYLSDYVFDLTTYDGEMSELFARKALEVCAAVSDATTFDYITDPEQYRWFLLMVNMPFFASRLDWGTSIRGAWWGNEDTEFSSCGLWNNTEQMADTMTMNSHQWREFIAAVRAFASA